MIETLLHRVTSLHYSLFGSTKLLPHEQMCLDAWRETLSETNRQILDAQLLAAKHVQRGAAGAKVCYYFHKDTEIPLFRNTQPVVYMATVTLQMPSGTDKQRMPVKLFTVNGHFFSIEFPKRPERYMDQHGMQADALQVGAVEIHNTPDQEPAGLE